MSCYRGPRMSNAAWRAFRRAHPHWRAAGCKVVGIGTLVSAAAIGLHVAASPVQPTANAAPGVAPVAVSDGASAVGATMLAWLPMWIGGDSAGRARYSAPPGYSRSTSASTPTNVPEPSTLAVFAVGAAVTILVSRRTK